MEKTRKIFDLEMQLYKESFESFPWTNVDAYANWLAQTYYYARQTTRVISFAGSLFPIEQQNIHNRFLDHAREEKNHDRLLINDMKALGLKMDGYEEGPAAAALYQTQFYLAAHVHPIALFGYFLSLEGLAITCANNVLKMAEPVHGARATTFLRVHGAEDIEHVKEAFDKIKGCTASEFEIIGQNLVRTGSFYRNMLAECVPMRATQKLSRAA